MVTTSPTSDSAALLARLAERLPLGHERLGAFYRRYEYDRVDLAVVWETL